MPEKDDKYFDAKAEAKALKVEADSLEATILELKIKKAAAGKLDAVEQVKLDAGEQKLAELKAKEAEYIQIAREAVKAGSGVAATDYSHLPYYSTTLKKFGMESPEGQLGFYASSFASSFYAGRSVFRAYHLMKAAENIDKPDIRINHMDAANATEHQVQRASRYAAKFASKGLAVGFGVPIVYALWFGAKYRANLKNRGH